MLFHKFLKPDNRCVTKISHDVDMGFECNDERTELFKMRVIQVSMGPTQTLRREQTIC